MWAWTLIAHPTTHITCMVEQICNYQAPHAPASNHQHDLVWYCFSLTCSATFQWLVTLQGVEKRRTHLQTIDPNFRTKRSLSLPTKMWCQWTRAIIEVPDSTNQFGGSLIFEPINLQTSPSPCPGHHHRINVVNPVHKAQHASMFIWTPNSR